MLCISLESQTHSLSCCDYSSLICYIITQITQNSSVFSYRDLTVAVVLIGTACVHFCQVEGHIQECRISLTIVALVIAQRSQLNCAFIQGTGHKVIVDTDGTVIAVYLRCQLQEVPRAYPVITSYPSIRIIVRSFCSRSCTRGCGSYRRSSCIRGSLCCSSNCCSLCCSRCCFSC